ncbi:hypothetical protein D557_1638 [Bordetella holmesii 70147]|nr:hypothetical protein D557_1638 [Bordetella holmesii 70147]
MSQDENDRPRKTLTIKAKPAAPESESSEPNRRKRSGARARQAAQIERASHVQSRGNEQPVQRPDADAGYAERPLQRRRSQGYASAERGTHSRGDDTAGENRRRSGMGVVRDETPRQGAPAPDWDDVFAGQQDEPEHDGQDGHAIDTPQAYRQRRHQGRQAETFRCYAPCPQGLEDALTAEMQALGFDDAHAGRAGCAFTSDWSGVQRANLYSRLATRILVQVGQGDLNHEDELLDLAYSVPWERWFGPEDTLRVDTSAIKSPVHSLQYCNLRVKDGICDRLRDREGARPSIDTVRPDARVQLFMEGTHATLYLDTSGESLFKRGWRLDKGEAPLRENLAAGMLALAGWDPAAALVDPFCGSGTILIEAAWIALGVPPGISRPSVLSACVSMTRAAGVTSRTMPAPASAPSSKRPSSATTSMNALSNSLVPTPSAPGLLTKPSASKSPTRDMSRRLSSRVGSSPTRPMASAWKSPTNSGANGPPASNTSLQAGRPTSSPAT